MSYFMALILKYRIKLFSYAILKKRYLVIASHHLIVCALQHTLNVKNFDRLKNFI